MLQSLAASVLGHNQQHRTPEHGLSAAVWKLSGAAGTGGAGAGMGMGMGVGLNLAEKKIQPLTLVTPEEQTDNWDDDFEEGISFTKLQGSFSYSFLKICVYLNYFFFSLGKTYQWFQ